MTTVNNVNYLSRFLEVSIRFLFIHVQVKGKHEIESILFNSIVKPSAVLRIFDSLVKPMAS